MVRRKRKVRTGIRPKPKTNARRIFLYTLGAGVVAGGAYLTWEYIKRKHTQQQLPASTSPETIVINNNLPATTSSGSSSSSSGDSFPLKSGSRGARVTQLQQALDTILGVGTMKKSYGGIDGIFGPLTASALKKAGYGTTIDQATFSAIISRAGGSAVVTFNAQSLASTLYQKARASDITGTLSVLQQINSTDQYSQVNTYYKQIPIVSKTIVTDLLDYAFKSNEVAKQQIRNEFFRMGLKMNSSGIWSLSGISPYQDIITLRETYVVDAHQNRIPVHANTILGDPIEASNGMTWFRSIDNSILQVPTQDVRYT